MSGSVIELGAGSLKKTGVLLRNLASLLNPSEEENKGSLRSISYYALDLEHGQLVSTLNQLAETEGESVTLGNGPHKISAKGICASYEDAFPYLKQGKLDTSGKKHSEKKCILFLGSSIGNYSREEAVDFLTKISDTAMTAGDSLLIGVDSCDDKARIELAYNDPSGVTASFCLNGIDHANRVLGGKSGLSSDSFEYVSRYNKGEGRHEVRPQQYLIMACMRDGFVLATRLISGIFADIAQTGLSARQRRFYPPPTRRTHLVHQGRARSYRALL